MINKKKEKKKVECVASIISQVNGELYVTYDIHIHFFFYHDTANNKNFRVFPCISVNRQAALSWSHKYF